MYEVGGWHSGYLGQNDAILIQFNGFGCFGGGLWAPLGSWLLRPDAFMTWRQTMGTSSDCFKRAHKAADVNDQRSTLGHLRTARPVGSGIQYSISFKTFRGPLNTVRFHVITFWDSSFFLLVKDNRNSSRTFSNLDQTVWINYQWWLK